VVAGQRQFIAAAGAGAADRRDVFLARIGLGGLIGVAGLVGELAEVDLVGMGGAAQHADICPGTKDPVLARTQHDDPDAGMLEPHPLHDIGQFDVDAEVVGVQLQLIALEQAAILVDIHDQGGDRPVIVHAPVAIARRIGAKVDDFAHGTSPGMVLFRMQSRSSRGRCKSCLCMIMLLSRMSAPAPWTNIAL